MINTRYNLSQAYIFAAEEPLASADIESQSIAWLSIASGGDDSKYNGIYFTLDEPKDVCIGFQANLAEGSGTQEFRADKVLFYGYGAQSGIEVLPNSFNDEDAPIAIYNLAGTRLKQAPQQGIYIVRQGNKTRKVISK